MGLLDDVEGIFVEDKSLAVTVHWRRAPDRDGAVKLVAPLIQEVIDTYALRHEPGKFVEELRVTAPLRALATLEPIVRSLLQQPSSGSHESQEEQ
ncbi:trehalose-phosphatase [Arthrobacter sp. SX1312]|uniref:trehalose-phosphatase n=1 Tax=Arthrobacter sp. SX1312 TaxID=2058896 RepID=UPI000CE2B9FA|nr:trehalose-phosphatase [Arthrobacter sp. SX1312]